MVRSAVVSNVIRRFPLADLELGDSPRLGRADPEHVRMLAEVGAELPPIVVHGPTLRVVDGFHRLEAAQIKGETHIDAHTITGTLDEAFVAAVQANVTHGKPLSRDEREAAARRILTAFPGWSDRSVGEVCGVPASTIAGIRQGPTDGFGRSENRVGRDGRVRPLDGSAGRRRAVELFVSHPELSAREVARRANISPTTASDVRARLRNGEDPVACRRVEPAGVKAPSPPSRESPQVSSEPAAVSGATGDGGVGAQLRLLANDAALQSTEAGRRCVELLVTHFVAESDWSDITGEIPRSRIYQLADLARRCGRSWEEFATALEDRASHG
jgi:ParB-like chromosome segregation protein Spo0J